VDPRDLAKLVNVTAPVADPSGRLAFLVSGVNLEEDRYDRRVWVREEEGLRPFTSGPHDAHPRWSPRGESLAILRSAGGPAQIAVFPARGGDPRTLTSMELGVEAFAWSPDGSSIAFVATAWSGPWAELTEEQRARRPRRVREFPYKDDARGWLDNRRRHIYLIDVESGATRCLTPGDANENTLAWHPDGRSLAFLSARHESRMNDLQQGVFVVDLSSGVCRQVAEPGVWLSLSYRPDGVLHMLGSRQEDWYPGPINLVRVEPDGELRDISAHLDRNLLPLIPPIDPEPIQWRGHDAVVALEDRGRVGLISVTPEGAVTQLISGTRTVTGFAITPAGVVIACQSSDDPGELYEVTAEGERRITDFNRTFRSEVRPVTPEHFEVQGPDGHVLDVWVYLPEGDTTVPVVLSIHGGPATQYGWFFYDEFQALRGAGFGVVTCNPRGSSGYGSAFASGCVGEGWGRDDVADLLACLDAALTRYPRLDSSRIGVMGGSVGGFLTGWLISHETRFRSAVIDRALLDWQSFAGTSDVGHFFSRIYLGAELLDEAKRLRDASPLSAVSAINTPTLLVHGEHDHRAPIEQAEQLYAALRKRGVPTELMRFPQANHNMTRTGSPEHRVLRMEAVLDWHREWLTPTADR